MFSAAVFFFKYFFCCWDIAKMYLIARRTRSRLESLLNWNELLSRSLYFSTRPRYGAALCVCSAERERENAALKCGWMLYCACTAHTCKIIHGCASANFFEKDNLLMMLCMYSFYIYMYVYDVKLVFYIIIQLCECVNKFYLHIYFWELRFIFSSPRDLINTRYLHDIIFLIGINRHRFFFILIFGCVLKNSIQLQSDLHSPHFVTTNAHLHTHLDYSCACGESKRTHTYTIKENIFHKLQCWLVTNLHFVLSPRIAV